MNSTTFSPTTALQSAPAAARTALGLLERLRHGSLSVQLPDGSMKVFGEAAQAHNPRRLLASISLRNWNPCEAALRSGDVGFAESYIAGDWSTPNLTELLKLFIANRAEVEAVIYGNWVGRALLRVRHWLNRNTRANSRKNIHAHYDLGNDFYRLWLDESMNYSAAWFNGDHALTMPAAQDAKVRRALEMARVQPGQRVLEIGCGWGALAEMAVTQFQANVTGVTLSTEQLAYARQRMLDATARTGARTVADLRLQDYRDVQDGPYDAVCSIEMVEAVGQAYWPTYFESVSRLLKPGGRACIQSIVIDDALFDRYIHCTDFIQQYIFPGGCLPSSQRFREAAARAGLKVVDELHFGADYAETLRRWRKAFLQRRAEVLRLGFDERFLHIWEFYLGYCEAAFEMDNIDVVQFTLERTIP